MAFSETQIAALIEQHFRLERVQTQRQDQWFKRILGRWKQPDGTIDLLIMTSQQPVDVWGSALLDCANDVASKIESEAGFSTARSQHSPFVPTDDKLFSDVTLDDCDANAICSAVAPEGSLKPVMQRLSYWTPSERLHGTIRQGSDAVRALMACEQSQALQHLTTKPDTAMKTMGELRDKRNGLIDWQGIVDDVLQLLFFIAITLSFEGQLLAGERFEHWAPYALTSNTLLRRYVNARASGPLSGVRREVLRSDMDACLRILHVTQQVSTACGLSDIKLNSSSTNAFLHFCGFEAWNRDRAGNWYLPCNFNVEKDAKWLQRQLSHDRRKERLADEQNHNQAELRPTKPVDPLKLAEPKSPYDLEQLTESEDDETKQLAMLEAEEVEYGRKRSTKYRPNKSPKVEG